LSSGTFQQRIAALTEFVVRARTHVTRDSYAKKEITYIPEAEAPTRLSHQLAQLSKGSARLAGRTEVNEQDYSIVRRCADSPHLALLTHQNEAQLDRQVQYLFLRSICYGSAML